MVYLASLGELMLRYSPPKYQRLRQASSFNVHVCGAQFNVAADLASLGETTIFLSKLPDTDLGLLARDKATNYGVDMSYVHMVPGMRIGTVYVEFAVEPRASLHIYDRKESAASSISKTDFAWSDILKNCRLAYTDGIFPGLSPVCRETTLEFLHAGRQAGCMVCFDMNYRSSLWDPSDAQEVYKEMLPYVDILVTNRAVSQSVLGFCGTDEEIAWQYRKVFGSQTVCLTSREMRGSSYGKWKSIALHQNAITQGRTFEFEVVDRFGTGDAFFSGFLYGYTKGNIQFALDFGNALCALGHTVEGDVVTVSAPEVVAVLNGQGDIHIQR